MTLELPFLLLLQHLLFKLGVRKTPVWPPMANGALQELLLVLKRPLKNILLHQEQMDEVASLRIGNP